MTSRVESFGMIGLEAMANGCLCVVADNPCLPEIFRDCALYYKPKDAAGLANAINLILNWKDEKKVDMSRKARERASEFSWDNTVNALMKELKKVVESNRRR
jgi:glycosyltransferase involved in cell wall biosynthesis